MGVGGRGPEVCGSGGGRPRLPIPNSPCACGLVNDGVGSEGRGGGGGSRVQELCRSQGGRPGLPCSQQSL